MTEIQQGNVRPKKVTIKLNSAFSPHLPHGESLRYASPTGLPPITDAEREQCRGSIQGKPIKKEGLKPYFSGRVFVNPERGISEQLIHQLPVQPLITIPSEKFKTALQIHVNEGTGKPIQKKTLGLDILPNISEHWYATRGHHFQLEGEDFDYSESSNPFFKSAFRDFDPESSPRSVAGSYGFSPMFDSLEKRLEQISFYNALKVLVKQKNNDIKVELDSTAPYILKLHQLMDNDYLTDKVKHGLVLESASFDDNHIQNLERIFGKSDKDASFENNKNARSINIGMLFVVKSLSKGWEFYHCKDGDDLKILAKELKDRYQEEQVSVNLITNISAVKRKSDDGKTRYDLNLYPRQYHKQYPKKSDAKGINIAEFIRAVEEKPGSNTTKTFFNEDASPLTQPGCVLTPAAKAS